MLQGLLAVALLLGWLLSTWVLTQAFDGFGRSVVLDDLGEYGALYGQEGIEGVRRLFAAGRHETDQFLRIEDSSGKVLLESALPGHTDPIRSDLTSGVPVGEDETRWVRLGSSDGVTLTIGGRRLPGGEVIWFGRSNAEDLVAIARVHRLIALAVGVTALLSIGPILWFAHQVLRPVRELIQNARRLVRAGPTLQRLETSGAIPEIRELAASFNEVLHQVQVVTDELEAANDQLAHELRTPLARIRGNIEGLLSKAASAEVREAAVRAVLEIERATSLIQAILTIRAGEARTMTVRRAPIDLSQVASATTELYGAAAEERGLRLFREGKPFPVMVIGDRERLEQALSGILDNALAYTGRGGSVGVRVWSEDGFGWVAVADTGPGLTRDDEDRIWRRFVRGSAASAAVPGIGLGLSVVRSILHAHDGEVGGRNRPEGGAEFWFRVPLAAPGRTALTR